MTAAQLRRWRRANFESKAAAARAIGVSYPTYLAYESGAHRIPEVVSKAIEQVTRKLFWQKQAEDAKEDRRIK